MMSSHIEHLKRIHARLSALKRHLHHTLYQEIVEHINYCQDIDSYLYYMLKLHGIGDPTVTIPDDIQ